MYKADYVLLIQNKMSKDEKIQVSQHTINRVIAYYVDYLKKEYLETGRTEIPGLVTLKTRKRAAREFLSPLTNKRYMVKEGHTLLAWFPLVLRREMNAEFKRDMPAKELDKQRVSKKVEKQKLFKKYKSRYREEYRAINQRVVADMAEEWAELEKKLDAQKK